MKPPPDFTSHHRRAPVPHGGAKGEPMSDASPAPKRKYTQRRRCQICMHPERARIELLHCAGVSLDRIAAQFDVHRDSIWRHAENHMTDAERAAYLLGPAKLGELIEVTAEEAGSVIEYYQIVRSILMGQLTRLAKTNDHSGVATIAARITHVLRDIAKITGDISTFTNSTIINVSANTTILNSAPFADLQAGLVRVCAKHPEARADIVALLGDLDGKYATPKAIPAPTMREIEGVAGAA
jgi:hypothetical protein